MIDKEEIHKAISAYEDEDFVTAKEILTKQIQDAKAEYLTRKLELSTPLKAGE